MEVPIVLDIDEEEDEELGEALQEAPEKDLDDLAGILGMHHLLIQPQYHNALLQLIMTRIPDVAWQEKSVESYENKENEEEDQKEAEENEQMGDDSTVTGMISSSGSVVTNVVSFH